jgi:CAAX prenyl protease-like protein
LTFFPLRGFLRIFAPSRSPSPVADKKLMSSPAPPTPDDQPKPPSVSHTRDDLAYVVPMLVFLAFTWLGGNATVKAYLPAAYPISYVLKTVVVAGLLVLFRRHYTKVRWDYWWLGAIVGVVGIFQWVGMQLWLQQHVAFFVPPSADAVFDPFRDIASPTARLALLAVRVAGATLLVSVMEELFWRDFLWRQILAPNDFKLASVGEWGWAPFLGVSVAFAFVHGNWWLTSVVWALMVGGLLAYTRSLGACIVAHAVTNALLAAYVLRTHDWAFW